MYNLIFFLPKFSLNGAGNSTYRLCKNLNKKKYKITIISLGVNSYKHELKKIGCRVYEIKTKHAFIAMFTILPLVKKISNNKSYKNIFISAHHHANVLSIIFLKLIKNIKIIGIERTDIVELLIFKNILGYIKNLFIYLLVKIFYKKSNLIISNSISGKRDLMKICKTKVVNIPSPSFVSFNHKNNKKKIDKLKIISVGRLSKDKGYKTIIEALSKLKLINFSMKILGEGSEKKFLSSMIKQKNLQTKIKLIGFKKNTKKYYCEADLFINASLFEGFPNALVEAISNDVPVICSNCKGGTKEIILNGKGGDLFIVNDSIGLAKKIMSFYRNQNKLNFKLTLARKNVIKYSLKAHVRSYEYIFNKI